MVRHLDFQIVLLGIASVADANVENIVKAALQLAHDPAPKDVRTRCRLLWPDQPDILRSDPTLQLSRTDRILAIDPQMMSAPDDIPATARVSNRHPSQDILRRRMLGHPPRPWPVKHLLAAAHLEDLPRVDDGDRRGHEIRLLQIMCH